MIVGSLPNIQVGDEIHIGESIYEFTSIQDLNSQPKLVFTFSRLVEE